MAQRPAVNFDSVADDIGAHLSVHRFVDCVRADHAQGEAELILGGSVQQDESLAVSGPIFGGQAADCRERLSARLVDHVGRVGPSPPIQLDKLRRNSVNSRIGCALRGQRLEFHAVADDILHE